jgi:two-component system, OmpR family, response regulator
VGDNPEEITKTEKISLFYYIISAQAVNMVKFVVWLLSRDREVAERWYKLFTRERFEVQALPEIAAIDGSGQGAWGIVFAEAAPGGFPNVKDLQSAIAGRKHISFIVFARPEKATNAMISEFLEKGADDFITSDIDEKILLSKTKAHIRRLLPSLNLARTVITSQNGAVEIDRTRRTVVVGKKTAAEKTLENLTPKEFEIFYMLLGSEAAVVTREMLMNEIWQDKAGHVNNETVDKHVETLRHKLGPYGKNIRTVYGAGYTYKAG